MNNGPEPMLVTRRVVCAALRNKGGAIILGVRHWDILQRNVVLACDYEKGGWKDAEQGFVDNMGIFMARREAHTVALAAGQIIRRVPGDQERLYSENLY